MDGSRQRSTGGMVGVVRRGGRCADADRAVSTEVDERNGHFRAENHEHPVGDVRARQFPPSPARESVSGERFPKRATYRLGGIQDGIDSGWIAEPAGSGDGAERVGAVVAMDQAIPSRDSDRVESSAYAAWIVPADHPKSPCRSP